MAGFQSAILIMVYLLVSSGKNEDRLMKRIFLCLRLKSLENTSQTE